MTMALSTVARNARAAALRDLIDAAAGAGTLSLYGTAQPAAGASAGAAPLVVLTLDDPCGTVDSGALLLADTVEAQVTTTGAPLWARLHDGAGVWLADMDAGVPGAGATLSLPLSLFYAGAFVRLAGASIGG